MNGTVKPDVPEVEHRRVERHQRVVLQQRVRAAAVERDAVDSLNGLAGPSMSTKKNSATTRPMMSAHRHQRVVDRGLRNLMRHEREVAAEDHAPTAGSIPRARPTAR